MERKTRHTCAPTASAIFRTNSKDTACRLFPLALLLSLSIGFEGRKARQTHDQMSISIWRSNWASLAAKAAKRDGNLNELKRQGNESSALDATKKMQQPKPLFLINCL